MDKSLRFMADLIAPLRVAPGSPSQPKPRPRSGIHRQGGQGPRPTPCWPTAWTAGRIPGPARRPGHVRRAAGAPGAGRLGQGRHDQARDERRQPAGGEVHAFKQPSAEELNHDYLWRCQRALPAPGRDRHLQPVALRGGARRPGASGPARRGAPARPTRKDGRLGPPLPRDQRLGTLPGRQRHPRRQDHAQPVQAGAGQAVPQADRPPGEELEVLAERRQGAALLGRLPAGLQRHAQPRPAPGGRRGTSCRPITSGSAAWPPPRSW